MNGKRPILVVDDDISIRQLVQMLIEDELGVPTVGAGDGREALRAISELTPILVVLDIMMPGVDGLHVLRQMKSQPATRGIPVIAISAVSSLRLKMADIGCDEYLAKPFEIDSLLKTVARHLRRARASSVA
ncbi:MAG: response regulator [Chloroflexota bacterium]